MNRYDGWGKQGYGDISSRYCEKILKFCLTDRKGAVSIHVNLFTAFLYSHCVVIHNMKIAIHPELFGCFLIRRLAD